MSGITIHEMESVARGMGPDISLTADLGGPIELGNDGLGLDMLSNIGIGRGGSEAKSISIDPNGPATGLSGGGMGEIELGPPLEAIEPITLNLGGPASGPSAPVEIQFSRAENDVPMSSGIGSGSSPFSNSQSASGPFTSLAPAPAPRLSPEEEKKEKADLLNKLQRLESKGIQPSRRYTMDNTLDEIKTEFARLVDQRQLEASLRFQRQALMSVVTGLEWMNGRFDPFDLKLDGWSESVHENVEDFDEIFEELYDKYKERGKMPPEARLVMALAGSGFMCHVSNTFLRSKMPSADDILKNNPDLARQFAAAAATQAGPGFGNFMNMAMGGSAPAPAAQPAIGGGPGAFFGSSAQQQAPPMAQMPQPVAAMEPPRQTARREMKGPTGVDDILRTFEEARRNEAMDGTAGLGPQVDAAQQPALAAAIEIQSMVSGDDIGSMAESTRTGRSGRRRRAAPIGNTVSLNV